MIDRALRLEDSLRTFYNDARYRKDLARDVLSDEDWTHLHLVHSALKPFSIATACLQGQARHAHHGAIWEAIPVLEYLLKHLETGVPAPSTN
jgi:hypothetical protein